MITNNALSEIGDVLIIYSQVIVNSSISISTYNDNIFGQSINRYFDKKFKYSLDGLNYSDWQDLNDTNLQQINGMVNGLLFFEFRYERVGTDNTGILEFNGIELIGNIEIQICENTSTLESIFAQLSENDFYTMSVRNNILRKVFHHGIIPKFIERGDDVDNTDFVSFWSAVCIFISYFSSFAENFDNILFKKEYLSEYLKQYNIQLNEKEIIYQHLFYISNNFYNEIRKRGTNMTIKKSGDNLIDGSVVEIDGEWLRLICRNHYDEFLFEIIAKEHSGFCLGKSSPIYNGTYFSKQLNKTEENTSDFLDLSRYTTIGVVNINTLDSDKKCLNLGYYKSGLGYDLQNPPSALNTDELIIIDEEVDYEITFNFKRTSDAYNNFPELNVGVLCYNRNGVLLNNATQNIQNNIPTNRFLKESIFSISKIKNEWYSFRVILYSKNSINIADSRTNLNKGNHLKIGGKNSQKVEKIKICLYSDISQLDFEQSESYFNIHDFKMRPLVRGKNILKNYLGKGEYDQPLYSEPYIKNPQFLQSNTFCLNWRKNNNQEKDDISVDNFIGNYLLPYQQKLVSIPLTPYVDDKQILI